MPNVSTEDYLKAVLKLRGRGERVTTSALASHLDVADEPVKGSVASLVLPVKVVKVLRTIHAEADQEFILVEKLAPLVVKENTVGLERVLDPCAGLRIFFLKFHGAPEEIEPH